MLKKSEYVKLKTYERKTKSTFMIYADLENMLVPESNRKEKPKESCTNEYQKHIACIYVYKLGCIDDKFSKTF